MLIRSFKVYYEQGGLKETEVMTDNKIQIIKLYLHFLRDCTFRSFLTRLVECFVVTKLKSRIYLHYNENCS